MRSYFAYAINMDLSGMGRRCPAAQLVGRAVLPGHRFLINREGLATVLRQPGALVHGVVWLIGRREECVLDDFEGLAHREYRKIHLPVRLSGGGWLGCLAYQAHCRIPGRPRSGYLEAVVRSAASLHLPDRYIDELRSWRGGAATIC